MRLNLKPIVLSTLLALGTTAALAAQPTASWPPGHDMNEQNINAPYMRELMLEQQGDARRLTVANAGHDMNEQNEHAPGMHERMRLEAPASSGGGALPPSDYPLVDRYNP